MRRTPSVLLGTALLTALVAAAPVAGGLSSAAAADPPRCAGRVATIVADPDDPDSRIDGTPRADVILGSASAEIIHGRGGDDVLCGGGADDELYGGAGRDRLLGQRDAKDLGETPPAFAGDTLDGGPGDDLLVPDPPGYAGVIDTLRFRGADGVAVDLRAGRATGLGRDRLVVGAAVELVGTGGDDVLVGASRPTVMDGLGGADRLVGGSGVDDLRGGRGPDVLSGRGGNDFLDGGEGDRLRGGADDDRLSSSADDPGPISAGTGSDRVDLRLATLGGQSVDFADGGEGDTLALDIRRLDTTGPLEWDLAQGVLSAPGAGTVRLARARTAELTGHRVPVRVTGSRLADRLVADYYGTAPVRFAARGGDDVFSGGRGADVYRGGSGEDTYRVDLSGRREANRCVSVEVDPRRSCG